ncbi:hypothetical protein PG994_001631 [Apiospora phragmitis]|uniref:Uncharacterized protein n=1 Tax=Apiospora phragmitis TaxID=2905665 RepID=A0ABR1WU79_9PEZI
MFKASSPLTSPLGVGLGSPASLHSGPCVPLKEICWIQLLDAGGLRFIVDGIHLPPRGSTCAVDDEAGWLAGLCCITNITTTTTNNNNNIMKVPAKRLPEPVFDLMEVGPLSPPVSPPAPPSPPAPSTPPSGLGVRFDDDPGYRADEEDGGSRTHNSLLGVARLGEVARHQPQIVHVSPRPLGHMVQYGVVSPPRRTSIKRPSCLAPLGFSISPKSF